MISDMTNKIIKIKNIIFAICADTTAIPVNPNIAAIIAMIKKVITQPSIVRLLLGLFLQNTKYNY
jgi:hypothetical protein